MFLLSCVLFLLVLLTLLDVIKSDIYLRVIIFFFVGFLLVILAGFRFGDRDYTSYVSIYDEIVPFFEVQINDISHGEPGYILLNKFCKTIGIGSVGVFFLTAFSSVTLSLMFFRKYTKYFFLAVLIYFSHVFLLRDMMQIRAGLAASISLYALIFVDKRKFWPFALLILLAASFHAGVLIIFLVYFSYPFLLKNDKRLIYFIVLGYILGLILKASLLEFFFVEVLNIPAVSIYVADSEYFKTLGLLNPVLLKSTFLIGVLYYYRVRLRMFVKHFDVFILSYVLSVFWLATFNNFSIFAARIATFLSNTEHLLIPALFYTGINKAFLWFLVVLYCIYLFNSKFEIFTDLSFIFL